MNFFLRLSAIVLVLMAATPPSQGALHYSDFQNLVIPSNLDGIYLNPLTGAASIVPPSDFETAPWLSLFFGGTAIGSNPFVAPVITAPATGNGDGLVLKVLTLQDIGPALNYASGYNGSENHTGSGPGQFQVGVPGYIGYAIRTATNGPVTFGWLRITVNDNGSGIIHDLAYQETPGVAILAGSVPEPGTAVLMLLTTAALVFSRRRSPVAS